MEWKKMFSPISIGNVTVPNRFVVPPMGNNFANTDGTLSDRSLAYYAARAKGGFGLITIEATVIDHKAKGGAHKPCLFSDDTIESLQRVADACHSFGSKVSVQLQHAGPEGNPAFSGYPLKAASSVPAAWNKAVPEEITIAELKSLAEQYGAAALRAKKAGIDFVELHCAHGYLLHSFLSPRTNHRTDAYGGCLENRMRLIGEIIQSIQNAAGIDLPILCRINGCDDIPGGLTIQDSAVIAIMLEEMGVSGLHISRAVHLRDDFMWATAMKHSGFSSDVVTEIKRAVSIPVITVGRFTEPHYGELLIRQGRADLIAFGRQSIADPNLPNRIRRGEYDRIQPCIGCLQGCVPNLLAGKPITCLVNPAVGKEGTANCLTSCPKKIMVVGGGPAGLMAAKSCAEKGHTVHLYEGSAKVGGQLLPASVPPGKGTISAVIQAYRLLCEDSGVTFHYNTTVTAEQIACEAPDVLVLATGGKPSRPPIPGLESSGCFDSVTVLNGNASCGKKVLILGGGMVGCETAAFLGERGHTVTILERQSVVGGDMGAEHRLELQALFHQYSIKEITNATVLSCLKDGVQYEKNGIPQQLDGFDSIVLALGAKRWNPLEDTAKDMGIPYVVIGDASAPRRALDATREGYDFAETMSSYK